MIAGLTIPHLAEAAAKATIAKWESGKWFPSPTRLVILLAQLPKPTSAFLAEAYASAIAKAADIIRSEPTET